MLVSIPSHVSVSDSVKKVKGRSYHKIKQEFSSLKRQYWGKHFWGRGFFSTTSGNVTDDIINDYINNHSDAHRLTNEINISLE